METQNQQNFIWLTEKTNNIYLDNLLEMWLIFSRPNFKTWRQISFLHKYLMMILLHKANPGSAFVVANT